MKSEPMDGIPCEERICPTVIAIYRKSHKASMMMLMIVVAVLVF